MSATLIGRSPALQRLQNEGYELEIRNGTNGVILLVHSVPYVNSQREVKRGTLMTPMELSGEAAASPVANHQAWFIGEHPCNHDGTEINEIKHSSAIQDYGGGVVVDRGFSAKLRNGVNYPDYFVKMTRYIEIISAPAQHLQRGVTAKTFKPIIEEAGASVFNYADSASSRAGIGVMSSKLALPKIAIIGLGGTGSYVLDLVAKTHVQEIHLFDGDKFYHHNAFRAPGAPALEALTNPPKVVYFANIYGKMRRGIIAHEENIIDANTDQLAGFDFVFICIDKPLARKVIFDALHASRVPFIDVGMDVQMFRGESLLGQCRTTLSTPTKTDHIAERVSFGEARKDDMYASDIQVADLNALNATLAVIKWKKYFGFYADQVCEHHSVYSINTHGLTRDVMA